MLLPLAGCEAMGYQLRSPFAKVQDTRIGPGKMTPDGIQSEVMSFADTFMSSIAQRWNEAGAARATPNVPDPAEPDESPEDPGRVHRSAHERKLADASSALSIAASPNPIVSVADMITMVTLERMQLEDPATEALFGPECTEKLIATYREHEAAIWRIGSRVFFPKQQNELRDRIDEWHEKHPDQRYVSQVRLEGFAATRQQQLTTAHTENASLLSLVMLDPLSGLDPAKREVQESRMLAARAFFYLTRMPMLLKWQTESLYQNFFRAPEVRDTLSAVTQVSEAADRISKTAEQLPRDFAAERQVTLDQFFAGVGEQREALLEQLDQGQDKLQGTLKDFRETVDATNELAGSLTTAAQAIESVADRIMPSPDSPASHSDRNGLEEYRAAVAQTGESAERLTVLAGQIDHLLDPAELDQRTAAVQETVTNARQSAEGLVDYAFKRLLILVVVAPLMILLAAASYRGLLRRSQRPTFDGARPATPLRR
jgi:exonuclease VII small subunit